MCLLDLCRKPPTDARAADAAHVDEDAKYACPSCTATGAWGVRDTDTGSTFVYCGVCAHAWQTDGPPTVRTSAT